MSNAPFISVVIPTCHRNDLLARCLKRLGPGAQTLAFEKYEVIVTDDGSRSTAQEMIEQEFPWARWVEGPRRGPAANRNNGARTAQGDWLAFTDDDCVPEPGWLSAFHETIRPQTSVYEGRTTCNAGLPSPLFASPVNEKGGYLWSCNMMVSRSVFERLGGFDESFPFAAMEDVDLRERLKGAEEPMMFVPEATVDHPPRRVPPPSRLAAMRESEYMFFARAGKAPRMVSWCWHILYVRLREIYRHPRGLDALLAFPYAVAEVFGVARRYPSWRRKYTSGTQGP